MNGPSAIYILYTVTVLCFQVFANTDLDQQEKDIMTYSLILVGLGVLSLCSMFMQVCLLAALIFGHEVVVVGRGGGSEELLFKTFNNAADTNGI